MTSDFSLPGIVNRKLGLLRSAAPRADLRIIIGCGTWTLYGPEAETAHRLCPTLVSLRNHGGDDIMDDPASQAEVALRDLPAFFDAITRHHSIAVVDVAPADRVHTAAHVKVLFLPRVAATPAVKMPEPAEDDWA